MLIKRKDAFSVSDAIRKLSEQKFNIKLQYKFIKLEKEINADRQIFQELINKNCADYFERDENNMIITLQNGGVKIKKENLKDCQNLIDELYEQNIQLNDIYFNLDELEPLGLTLGELSLFEPFIK